MGFCPLELGPYFPARHTLTREVDGKKFVYEGTFYHLVDGHECTWTVCTFRDITQMFNLESQVRQLDELERMLVQASMDGIIVNDLLGNILIFNEGASRILGYRPEEVDRKMKASDLYPDKQAHEIKQLIYSPATAGSASWKIMKPWRAIRTAPWCPSGCRPASSGKAARRSASSVISGTCGNGSAWKRSLVRNERLATLGRMVAHVSHEIKNPLAAIGGFAQQCERQADLPRRDPAQAENHSPGSAAPGEVSGRFGSLRPHRPHPKVPGDILALIQEVAEFMEGDFQEKKVEFDLQAPGNLPAVSL